MITLKEIKDCGLAEAMNLTPDDARFLSYLNVGVERVMQEGHWKGTIRRMRLRVTEGNKVYVPTNVESIEKISLNGHPQKIHGEAFEFLESGFGVYSDLRCQDRQWRCSDDLVDSGLSATMAELREPYRITAQSDADECTGASITITGYNVCNEWIRSQDSDGCWQDGVTLMLDGTADTNPPTSVLEFLRIQAIVKDDTKGQVTVTANRLNGTGIMLAKLNANQHTSSYRVYTIPAPSCRCCPNDRECLLVSAIVKMAFVPVKEDRDVFSIDLMGAIKDAAWSEYYADKPDGLQASILKRQSAIMSLDKQLSNFRGSGEVNPIASSDDGTWQGSYLPGVYGTYGSFGGIGGFR